MHFALASVVLFAALASASTLFASQDISHMLFLWTHMLSPHAWQTTLDAFFCEPACISECVKNSNWGNCSETDYNCFCNNAAYIDSVMGCVGNACPSDLAAAQEAGQELCLPFVHHSKSFSFTTFLK